MDKTIEIVVVAMVVLVAATVVLFLFQDQTDGFGNFLDNQQSGAQCQLLKAQEKCGEFNDMSCSGSCSGDGTSGSDSTAPPSNTDGGVATTS